MSRQCDPLPSRLGAFGFTLARGSEAGLTPRRLRGPDLVAPTSGVRMLSEPNGLVELATAYAMVLPAPWAYSHLTAARLLGLPVGGAWTTAEPLHVVRPTALARFSRHGTVHHRGLESRATVSHHDLPVVCPVDTWCDLAAGLTLDERVVLADAVVNVWSGDPLAHLEAAVDRRSGREGVRAMREALPLTRTRSRSPMETRARLAFAGAGLPEPELNADVFDADGGWLANSDFVWRERGTLAEYDGDQHRTDRRRWRSDHQRRRELIGAGWRVHTLTADDFATPGALRRCIAAIARDLAQPS